MSFFDLVNIEIRFGPLPFFWESCAFLLRGEMLFRITKNLPLLIFFNFSETKKQVRYS